MPTYVYACKGCEDRTEVIQKMSDDALTTCEKCGGDLRRVLFPPAVVYKGSGFYVTDYKNNGSGSATSLPSSNGNSEGKGESKSEGGSESKTETKSETKAESKPEIKSESKSAS